MARDNQITNKAISKTTITICLRQIQSNTKKGRLCGCVVTHDSRTYTKILTMALKFFIQTSIISSTKSVSLNNCYWFPYVGTIHLFFICGSV